MNARNSDWRHFNRTHHVLNARHRLPRVNAVIEDLGTQETFEVCLRCLRPGGTLPGLDACSWKLQIPYEAYAAGLRGHRIVIALCPGRNGSRVGGHPRPSFTAKVLGSVSLSVLQGSRRPVPVMCPLRSNSP